MNVATTCLAANVAAKYLRRIAPDFSPVAQSHLESAAAGYDRIVKQITPFAGRDGQKLYIDILSDISKQKAHAANVLTPVKLEYSAIAHELELAIGRVKP